MVAIGEHHRTVGQAQPAGIYRVVGTPDDVTLLRVADDGGRRRYTGVLLHVSEETLETNFESARNPDAGFRPVSRIRNQLQGLYWSVRRFF